MTVAELIVKLQQLDPDLPVIHEANDAWWDLDDVTVHPMTGPLPGGYGDWRWPYSTDVASTPCVVIGLDD